MPTIYDAVVLASVVVGLVSIPAASQTIDGSNPATGDFVSKSFDAEPRESTTEMGPDGFSHRMKTAFVEFTEDISPGSTEIELETPTSSVTIENQPGEKKTVLSTNQGELTVKRTESSLVERTETPEGVLERRKEHGTVTESFEGSNRDAVEETRRELRDILEEKRQSIRNRSKKLEEAHMPEINVSVKPEDNEYVELTNLDTRDVSLEGWKLRDESGTVYEFPSRVLESGESLKVYTSDGENSGSELHWGTSNVWNNEGDTATILNSGGEVVAEKSY